MEKNYQEVALEIKNEILDEIRRILPGGKGQEHKFATKFYIHYIEGEVSTAEVCKSVEVREDEMVVFNTEHDGKEEQIEAEEVYCYSVESFAEILNVLRMELREEKLSTLRELVKKKGGNIKFHGIYTIGIKDDGEVWNCALQNICTNLEGELKIGTTYLGDEWSSDESEIADEDLDKLIAWAKIKTKENFSVKVSGSYSRTFKVCAENYEEALEKAKAEWDENPLCKEDANGEDWDWNVC